MTLRSESLQKDLGSYTICFSNLLIISYRKFNLKNGIWTKKCVQLIEIPKAQPKTKA